MPNKGKKTLKKESKDFFDYIDDAIKDEELRKKMVDLIKKKGKGETPQSLLKKFNKLGYDNVSLHVCKKILIYCKRMDPEEATRWDWGY